MIIRLKPALVALVMASMFTACGDLETPAIALGQTGGKDGVELTLTDVNTASLIGSVDHGSEAGPAEIFVIVNYTMKNVGPTPLQYLDRPDLTLLDAAGNNYASDDSALFDARNRREKPITEWSDLNTSVSAKNLQVWKVEKATFDRATWKVRLDTPSQALFALK